jgi:hypothetical protein
MARCAHGVLLVTAAGLHQDICCSVPHKLSSLTHCSPHACLGDTTLVGGIRLRPAFAHLHIGVLQVRSLAESTGDVDSATPSLAVQMVGLNAVPTAGDEFYVCADETMARKAAEVAEDAQVSLLTHHVLSTAVLLHLQDLHSVAGSSRHMSRLSMPTELEARLSYSHGCCALR